MKVQIFEGPDQEEKDERNEMIPPPLPKIGQHLLLCAPTGSGKSQLIANLLAGPYQKVFDKIYWFTPTWDHDIYKDIFPAYEELIHRQYSDEALQAIEDEAKKASEKGKPMFNLIILDDSMGAWRNSAYLNEFPTLCRHYNLTIWTAVQYCKGAVSKAARMQFAGLICFASSKEADVEVLADLSPVGKAKFKSALEAVREENTRDGHTFHTLYCNTLLPNPFYMDIDIPIVPYESEQPTKRVASQARGGRTGVVASSA